MFPLPEARSPGVGFTGCFSPKLGKLPLHPATLGTQFCTPHGDPAAEPLFVVSLLLAQALACLAPHGRARAQDSATKR